MATPDLTALDEERLGEWLLEQRWFGSKAGDVSHDARARRRRRSTTGRPRSRSRSSRRASRRDARALPAAPRHARGGRRLDRDASTTSAASTVYDALADPRAAAVLAAPDRRAARRSRASTRPSRFHWGDELDRPRPDAAGAPDGRRAVQLVGRLRRRAGAQGLPPPASRATNPELEMLRFLTSHGFPNIADARRLVRVRGELMDATLGVLQRFVADGRDGWELALDELGTDPEAFLARLAELGAVIGRMHTVLGSDALGSRRSRPRSRARSRRRCSPRRSTRRSSGCSSTCRGRRGARADRRPRRGGPRPPAAALARRRRRPADPPPRRPPPRPDAARAGPLDRPRLRGRAGAVAARAPPQALAAARRRRDAALVRLRRVGRRDPARPRSRPRAGRTARARRSSRATSATVDPSLLPPGEATPATLLSIFELEKAVYELRYELNNRPDWVRIPVAGIARLLEERRCAMTRPPMSDATSRRSSTATSPTRTGCSARTRTNGGVVVRAYRPDASRSTARPDGGEPSSSSCAIPAASSRARSRARSCRCATSSRSPTRTAARSRCATRTRSCRRSASSTCTSPARAATRSSTRSSARTCARSTASPASRSRSGRRRRASVSVVGDFNSWDGRLHPMRSLGSIGHLGAVRPRRGRGRALQVRDPRPGRLAAAEGRPVRVRRRGAAADGVGRAPARATSGATRSG